MGCPVGAEHDAPITDEPIGNIYMSREVFRSGDLLQERGDGDIQACKPDQLVRPFLEAVDVGPGNHFATSQDVQSLVEPGLAAGGQPEVLGHQAGSDDSRLLTLHQGNWSPWFSDVRMC